ncbi:branched-chain amino acid ABC transporter substrate-binding protein [Frankia sp. Ag45/Mut15]|uniref:Branched-chain amino acid ABC transporter substrate-binding protein n=1 Tax=Frankia umida TaxID=573489 RepID=A0ABT0JUJ4_9ACTN|nr:branched-chain amino acid ABC transporter substrate-binding protein [Frankia umida]MCK9875206.1 branched-chain amino acid ABC transporter substrate-binding protein [Frankia umida]
MTSPVQPRAVVRAVSRAAVAVRAAFGALAGGLGRWVRARAGSGRGRVFLALLAVVVLAVPSLLGLTLASALDGSDGHGGAGTRVATIGVMAPLSGDLSADGAAVRNAVALAVEEANESGAIAGWRLELSSRDDLARVDGGAQAADVFTANERLIGVVGPVSSLVARVAVPTLAAAGVPVVSPSNADPVLTGVGGGPRTRPYPSYFRLTGTDDLQAQVAAEYAVRTLGRRHIAVVDGEPRYGTTLADRFTARATALGASVTSTYPVRSGDGDDPPVDEVAASLEREAPDLIYLDADASFAGKLRARLAEGGLSVQVLGSDALLRPRYLDEAKSAADGDLITSLLTAPTRLPAAGAFVAAYAQRFGGVPGPGQADETRASRTSGTASAAASATPAADPAEADTATPAAAPSRSADEQADHDAAVKLAQRRAEALPAVAAYAYDAARAIIRAAATVLPGRPGVDAAVRHDLVAAIGRASFVGVSGTVGFDRYGDTRSPSVALYTVLAGRFVALSTQTR